MESKVYLETSSGVKEIKILPKEASSKTLVKSIDEMKITEENGKPIYYISGEVKGRLLLIIPISAKVTQKINIETGEIVSTKKPWWSFLATGI